MIQVKHTHSILSIYSDNTLLIKNHESDTTKRYSSTEIMTNKAILKTFSTSEQIYIQQTASTAPLDKHHTKTDHTS